MDGHVLLLLTVGISAFAMCHCQTTEKIGNLTLVCPQGWTFYGTSCYLKVSKAMEWEAAQELCMREQGMPLDIQDEVENKALADMAGSWKMFWVGDKIKNSCTGYWDVNEPPASVKEGDCAAVQKNGRWKVVSCQSRLPFFCKTPSCLEGSFDCGRGKCLNSKWKCDGINDCGNNRDEMDCSSKCTFTNTGASGRINYFSGYANNADCMWTIISPPGTQLGVTFSSVRLEDKVDLLEVRVGGQTILDTRVLETLTGSLSNKVIFSTNNIMLLRLTSDSSVTTFGFDLTWSSSNNALSTDVRPITAGSSWTDLTSPFFPSTPPSGFRLEWLVSSSDNTIVTLMVEDVDLGPDWMLMVYNGEGYDDSLLMASRRTDLSSPAIYISTASKIRIILKGKDTSGGGRGIKLRVKNGCNVEIQAASGTVTSPGFNKKIYPTSVTCSWKIQAPSGANRNLMVKFLYLVLETVGKDLIEIYNGSDASAAALHSGSGYTGDLTSSLPSVNGGNTLFVRFKSSLIQDEGGFQFEFSIDCPTIPASANMAQSSAATAYLSSVTVNCNTGYSFKQEEYYQKATVSFLCEKGGKWDNPRYPTCQVVYCGAPDAIEFGFVKNYSGAVTYNSKAVYECYNGFTMKGTPEVTCGTSGKWQTLPTCESATCGAAPAVTNADSNIITTTGATSYGAIVEYTCNAGYEIKGSSRRLCNTTNTWTNTAPTCERKKCALPQIALGLLNVAKPADFEDKVTLACEPGYWASTTNKTEAVLTCKADGRFEEVSCVDEDECVTKSPCLSTQTCVNNVGSYKCVCRHGYRPGTPVLCEDINECSDGNGGCQDGCQNSPRDPTPAPAKRDTNCLKMEPTRSSSWKARRVSRDLTWNTCPRPSDVTNGVLHSKKQTFFYQDEIMYSCQLGFTLSGNETRTCQAPGTWSGSDPTCTAVTCSAQTSQGTDVQKERAVRIVPTTPVPFKGKVVIECRKEDSSTFNKTLYCAYDSKTKTYTLQGDSPICPVVDCGPVEDIAGFNKPNLATIGSTFGKSFQFSCRTGATPSGVSTENSNTVRCLQNGRWGFGNLTCIAATCPDPGTPGGSEQIFDSYEQGKVVAYRCTRPGFTPVPDDNRTCVYSDTAKSASWSGSVPVCEDTSPPVFTNCDGDRNITINKMQVPSIATPSVQDNSGFLSMKGFILPRGFNPADPVWRNTEVTYEATDGAGRSSQCKFQINVRGRKYGLKSSYVITEPLSVHPNQRCRRVFNAMFILFQVFLIWEMFPRADQQSTERRHYSLQQQRQQHPLLCRHLQNGYALADGSTSRTYNCSGENLWSPSLPLEDCLPSSTTEYTYKVSLDLKSKDQVPSSSACRDNLGKFYNDVISPTTSGINNLCQIQGQLNAKYRFSVAEAIFVGVPALFDHKVELTLKLENNDGQNAALELCAGNINLQKTVLFGLVDGGCNFTVQDSSTGVNLTRSGQSCSVGYRLRDVGGSKKCLPCPHGYSSSPSGGCVECPDGQYQDQPGQPSCKSCGSNMYSLTPRTSSARCVSKCRPGFFSTTGQQPCDECQEDRYWVNATHCLPCPDGGSTLYVEGTTSISACRAPCPSGQYSVTGYAPCTPCPRHFYQDSTAQTRCKECGTDQITEQTGSKTLSDCKPGNTTLCADACSSEGTSTCTYIYHRLVCTCKPGYTGDKCDTQIDYCMSSPCLNGATCKPKLGGFDCQCPAAEVCKMVKNAVDYNPGIDYIRSLASSSVTLCSNECISNSACVATGFFTNNNLCVLLNAEQAGKKTTTGTTQQYFDKDCANTPYFSGKYCQTDLRDDCETNDCRDYSVCRDLLGGNKCVCPSRGQYTQPRCDRDSNLCSPQPCKNSGTCNSWGDVRYQCTCLPGFTGVNCETEVDECKENPSGCLYGGTCVNGDNSYSCTCKPGFGDDHCHNEAVLCTSGRCSNGLCINNYDNVTADCICDNPFEKDSNGECTEKDFCSPSPCATNNTERCDKLTGGYRCVCKSGYEGSLCQHNIDDCASKPCVHGTCVDKVTTFSCQCDDGWTGPTCTSDIVDCKNQCPTEKTERCVDLNQDYRCECKPGYTGKNCTEMINECDSLPCMHGGTCVDQLADYSCNCTPGWEGKNCQNIANTCSGISCQNDATCFPVFEDYFCSCQKGTQGRLCESSPKVCDLVKPCTAQGTCQQSGGSATCKCGSLYSGVSCELIKDTCSANVCNNGGNCSLVQPMGHTCNCPEGFSGDNCQTKDDVCSNKCPSGTTCLSEGRETFCLCTPPKILSGTSCKDTSPDFDLYLDNRLGSQVVQSYNPFQLTGDLSIMFWIGYLNSGRSVVISNLDRSEKYFELFQDRVQFSAAGKVVNMTLEKADLETVKGQWDHVAATWTRNGSINVFINGIKVTSGDIDVNLTDSNSLKIVWFDPAFNGYISRLTVWRGILTHTDVTNVLGNLNYQPTGDLALGWNRYKMAGGSRIYVPSKAGTGVTLCEPGRVMAENCTGQPDKKKPVLKNCPTTDVLYNVSTRVVEAIVVYTAPSTDSNAAVSSTFTDELMMRGRYDIVYVAKDNQGNVELCRFNVYIRGSSTCSTEGFLAITPCGATAVRDFCPTGQAPSIPTPNILSCGKLGSYNLDNPLELYTPPACGATSDQKYSVEFTLIYQMTLTCSDFLKEGLLRELRSKFVNSLSDRWPGLCVDACTNLVAAGRCDAKKIVVSATLTKLGSKITKKDNSITLSPAEIIKITAIESNDLSDSKFMDIGLSMLQKDLVVVVLKASCDEAVGTSSCVACGHGSFLNSTLGQCELCPVGTYSDASSQTSCKTCGVKTTLRPGARTLASCVDKCPAGQYFQGSSCSPCPRDYYQEKEGQSFCYPCPLLKRTRVAGTDSASKCFNGCPSGTDLQDDGSCKDCAQGYFRTRNLQDSCEKCPSGKTTEGDHVRNLRNQKIKTTSSSGCNLPDCPSGRYIDMNRLCKICEIGTFQTTKWQRSCISCNDSYTTTAAESTQASDCKFLCPAGQEESPVGSRCSPCPRGKYRDSSMLLRFQPCQTCSTGFTTKTSNATNSTDCSIRICTAGNYRNATDNTCYPCPVGQYQPQDLQDQCLSCNSSYSTSGTGTVNATGCIFFCPDGYELKTPGTRPAPLPRGTYRSNTDLLRFKTCQACADSTKSTDDVGSKLPSDCKIKVCSAGQKLTDNMLSCVNCPVDTYQPEALPNTTTQCLNCTTNYGTKQPSSGNSSDCLPFCAAGQQVNGSQCEPCPSGTWNDGSSQMRFSACEACSDANFTTESTGSTSATQCTLRNCPPGYKIGASACEACAFGEYQPLRAKSKCESCGTDLNTSSTASTSRDQCTISCGPGKQGQNNVCSLCPADTFKGQSGFAVCSPCTGSKTSDVARTTCTLTFCDKGVGYNSTSKTCADCAKGFYKPARGNTACTSCSKNYTTTGTGTKDATGCNQLNCEPGFFAHQTATCTPCPTGYYKAAVGTENCTKCDAGMTTQAEGSTASTACSLKVCPAGEYRIAANTCQKCAVGEYQNDTGQTQCSKCGTGFTTKLTGSTTETDCLRVCGVGNYRSSRTECSVCVVGTYQPNTGAEACVNCTTGFTTSNNGSAAATDCYRLCPAGEYRPDSDRTACNKCTLGTYQPSSGKTSCISCSPPGYTTLQMGSMQSTDCMPTCAAGKYLNVTSRSCMPCPLGTFLPSAGTTQQCRQCPTGKTTTLTGSTQEANCDLVDCEPGYYRKENQGCLPCGKGYYQPTKGQISCIKCDVTTTTLIIVTTATSKDQCIDDCQEGKEYNQLKRVCVDCPIGEIRNPSMSDYCLFCPAGQTTAFAGSTTCVAFPASTPAPLLRTVRVRMIFRVTSCTNPTLIHGTIIAEIRRLVVIRAREFPSLCRVSSCGNIAIIFIVGCGGTRAKRQTTSSVTAELTASNLPERIPNTGNTVTRSPESLLTQALAANTTVAPALAAAGITVNSIDPPTTTTSCSPGSVLNSGTCVPCPVGTKHDTTSGSCKDCEISQYQDQTGQVSCKACAGKLSTSGTKSNNVSYCVSKCKLETGYCKNNGICRDGTDGSVSCDCSEYYTGDTCTVRRCE
ncbi:LOW QUALITY PROTEIN: uncharacterized protein LOC124262974 [Haliotis rubra]|uniref:LOW QUALITY PROTEIN: uncharacterized protein LOC124262974 n=1 Tax=Haliotis rubra TaxID=36100 RepID=UPI001EE5FD48|nr:LOW QUALITY PROTEIN: uncharacterized protein LOC124262974 [Haliotis rubra]